MVVSLLVVFSGDRVADWGLPLPGIAREAQIRSDQITHSGVSDSL